MAFIFQAPVVITWMGVGSTHSIVKHIKAVWKEGVIKLVVTAVRNNSSFLPQSDKLNFGPSA